ncbi:GntR family transcriptional regulator [Polynucleobacter necessarius]|uniref:GntR family transcriptional regulator n=1 Tax=Polynucleobacter necessarius TaxID=576610 RepID=UPI000FE25F2C|nr:GntR family transcriptional regulator [Polynucleobacter necessarius]
MKATSLGYQSLASVFRKKVEEGVWHIGNAIPSEASLAKEYGVALGTIRQAVAQLADEGILVKRHGKSTAVSSGLNGQSMLRFFRHQPEDFEQQTPQAKVLAIKEIPLDKEISKLTGWACKMLLKIHRIRLINGEPFLYETIYLPLPKFKRLASLRPDEFEELFYPMYAKSCGIAVIKANDQVGFELTKKMDAKALGMKEGYPAVRVNRIAFDLSGKPVEYRSSVGDAMAFQYSAEVN